MPVASLGVNIESSECSAGTYDCPQWHLFGSPGRSQPAGPRAQCVLDDRFEIGPLRFPAEALLRA
jgi:hypothetical protein